MAAFKLDFVGVGPQRTGTSWLHLVLMHHPKLCFPQHVKETMFFDLYNDKGLAWYTSHFAHRTPEQLCGEFGPTSFDSEPAAERIQQLYPGCKVIITLRNPISRAWSSYCHHMSKGRVTGTFDQAARQIPQIIDAGRYERHIPRWLQRFGSERVTVVLLEDIEADPQAVLAQVYSFVGVDEVAVPANVKQRYSSSSSPRFPLLAKTVSHGATWLRARRLHRINELGKVLGLTRVYSGGKTVTAKPESRYRSWLLKVYEPDISFVEELLKRDLSSWRQVG